ncbi:hypothetical protein DRO42_00195 [Candidatus Bathyarchaeota archaeon]|nr:MAG: hypothetical protein DRO42_00195 [Candidatus Bathyarchaeota archaeon]
MELTPEEEEEMIRKIARKIHKYGMEVATILFLESIKPLTYIGSQMGRFFISPFLPALGEGIGRGGEKFFMVFEKRENVEKLLAMLEELAKEEPQPEQPEKTENEPDAPPPQKKGWRRLLPF